MPTPTRLCEPISLHNGLNFVSVCLLLTTSLVGSSLFLASGSLWLEGNQIFPGVHTLSGPISLSGMSSMVHLTAKAMLPFSVPSHPKSRFNHPVPTLGSQTTGMIPEITENIDSLSDIPQSQEYLYRTVVVDST